jgi:SAM-dependent methyltransferase
MSPTDQPADSSAGLNQRLLRAVPPEARSILEVGCAEGRLGAALKRQDPTRTVYGVERQSGAAERAARRLDQVFCLDLERDELPLAPGSLDCLLYGDVLEHLADPESVLRRHRPLLRPGGVALGSLPNVGHHAVLTALLRGDWPPPEADRTGAPRRLFTYATALKLFLDAGFAPAIADTVPAPGADAFHEALQPLLARLGLHPGRSRRYLDAAHYVVRAAPLPEEPAPEGEAEAEEPLTFVACVSDEATLHANLLASPDLRGDAPHEVILLRGCPSAADGLNQGLARARHRLVVGLHQDVYLPRGWPRRFLAQYRRAEQALGRVGVAGVYGVSLAGGKVVRAGHVVDRDRLLREPPALPAAVETLDELLLALPRGTPLRFDPQLGFHFYGADVCLQARRLGMQVVALDAVCLHNSRSVALPAEFAPSGGRFAAKWATRLPVATSCVLVEEGGRLSVV